MELPFVPFVRPDNWSPMADDDTPPASRDAAWYARCDFVDVDLATPEAKALGALLRRGFSHCAAGRGEERAHFYDGARVHIS